MELPDSMSVPRNHDIVTIIIRDHEAVLRALDAVGTGDGDGASDQVWRAGYELIRHEVAEEQVLYPALHRCGASVADVGSKALAQQADVKRLLSEVETTGPADPDFEHAFEALKESVQRHVAFEEEEILPIIVDRLQDEERFELGDHYAQVKKTAPTHPHPRLPGDGLAMSVAAIFDRLADAMSKSRPRPNRSAGPNVSSDR